MSFGVSVSDIKLAWDLAFLIHEKCFTKAQGADVQYLRFGREIESFADNLQKLISIIQHANSQRPRRVWRDHDEECRLALRPLSQAIGDFKSTLEECRKLLDNHERFQRDTAGFVDNILWHAGTQRDVDILRERVHFHSTKLAIILKPFEIQLLVEIRREIREVRAEVAETKGLLVTLLANGSLGGSQQLAPSTAQLPDVPQDIAERFRCALENSPPASYQGLAAFPLEEGFDALVYHFARSTVQYNPGFDPGQGVPEETQFVNLLKSKWLMDALDHSSQMAAAGAGSLWASYLSELKADVTKEYERFHTNQLTTPPRDVVSRLPDNCFSIWVPAPPPLRPPNLAENSPLEDQVLELLLPDSLGARKTVLNVFKRSAIEFRLVTTTTDLTEPGYHREKDFIANTNVTRVIPAYATPGSGANSNNLLLSSTHVQDLRWQYLSSPEDVASLQQVLTGYRVHHDMANIAWSINGSSKPEKYGEGRLQLWQLQSLPGTTQANASNSTSSTLSVSMTPAATQSSLSTTSPPLGSGSKGSQRQSTTLSTATTMFSGSSATSVIHGSCGRGTAVLLPEPPVMVLFTSNEGKYAFLHLELSIGVFVNPESCDCRKNSKRECRRVVIESKQKTFIVRRLYAQQQSGKGLYTWDLAKFRYPRHPEYGSVEVLPKVKYITLTFQSVSEKDNFCAELEMLERVRNLEYKMYNDILVQKRKRDQRPKRDR
ncbi:MAG: hypothetical protein Q9163_003029 [Psora crenata]